MKNVFLGPKRMRNIEKVSKIDAHIQYSFFKMICQTFCVI